MAYYGNEPADVALKVGSGVITATEIQDASISTADISNDAITPNQLDDDATGFEVGSLGIGAAVSGSNLLHVAGPGNFTGAVTATLGTASQPNVTTMAGLVTTGTIGTGVWQGTPITSAYLNPAQTAITSVGTLTGLTVNSAITLGVSGSTNGKISAPEALYFNIDSDGTQTDTEFVWGTNRTGDSGGTEIMRLTESGNLGIGISAPTTAYEKVLHIHEASGSCNLHLTNNTTGSASSDGSDIIAYQGDLYIWNREVGNMHLGTSATTRVTIGSGGDTTFTGNVIGSGTANYFGGSADGEGVLNLISTSAGNETMALECINDSATAGTATAIAFQTWSGSHTAKIVAKLNAAAGAKTDMFFHLHDGSNANARVTFLHSGKVGIGTDVPSELLEIANTATNDVKIRFLETSVSDSYLMLDASADWFGLSSDGSTPDLGVNTASGRVVIGGVSTDLDMDALGLSKSSDGGVGAIQLGQSCNKTILWNEHWSTGTAGTADNIGYSPVIKMNIACDQGETSTSSQAANDRAWQIGLNLENNALNHTYAPFITWSRKSASGNYNSIFAAIGAQRTGAGGDSNWNIGDLVFYTQHNPSGASDPREAMRLASTGNVTGAHGSYHTSSDETLKKNISTISSGLDKVNAMRGVNFKWKKENDPFPDEGEANHQRVNLGFIAQELEAVIPEVVNTDGATGLKAVLDANQISAVLVEAIKELSAKVTALENA